MNTICHKANYSTNKNIKLNNITSSIKRYKFIYLMLAPAVIYVLIFSYLPMLGVVMAFQDFDIIKGFRESPFVGIDNFVTIFTYPKFLNAICNTLLYSSVLLFLGFPLPIMLALLFNELRSTILKKIVQTISYMPHFFSWISVIALFSAFFALDGTFNDLRIWLFGEDVQRINILMDSKYFLGILFGSSIWKNIGWNSVIFLAAIAGIDQSMYEAAIVDGCGRFKQIFYITIPSIMGTVVIVLILNMGQLVTSNFEQVFGFQNVFTQEKTEVINTLVYRQGIMSGQYSLSTAFGLAQGIVSFLIVFITNKLAKKLSGIGIW